MKTRGFSLVSTLATVAIILVMMVVLFKGSSVFGLSKSTAARKDGKGTTVLGATEYAAKDDVCRSNLGQVRLSLQVLATSGDDGHPADIHETKLPSEFYACPIGKEPYQYDPSTGTVHCVHPGHEKY